MSYTLRTNKVNIGPNGGIPYICNDESFIRTVAHQQAVCPGNCWSHHGDEVIPKKYEEIYYQKQPKSWRAKENPKLKMIK